jgi:hypothetical protein
MSPNIFERLCLRFKASDNSASMTESLVDSVTVGEPGEVPTADDDLEEVVSQDSSSETEKQICIPTGM